MSQGRTSLSYLISSRCIFLRSCREGPPSCMRTNGWRPQTWHSGSAELRLWISFVAHLSVLRGGRGKPETTKRSVEKYMRKSLVLALLWTWFYPTRSHRSLFKDLWAFSSPLCTVGISESLLVQLKPRYLKEFTISILRPCMIMLTTGLLICDRKICPTVFPTFIGCFQVFEYWTNLSHTFVPSSSKYFTRLAYDLVSGALMITQRSSANRWPACAPRHAAISQW